MGFKLQSLEPKHHPHLSSERTKGVVVQGEHRVVSNDAIEVPALKHMSQADGRATRSRRATLAAQVLADQDRHADED